MTDLWQCAFYLISRKHDGAIITASRASLSTFPILHVYQFFPLPIYTIFTHQAFKHQQQLQSQPTLLPSQALQPTPPQHNRQHISTSTNNPQKPQRARSHQLPKKSILINFFLEERRLGKKEGRKENIPAHTYSREMAGIRIRPKWHLLRETARCRSCKFFCGRFCRDLNHRLQDKT